MNFWKKSVLIFCTAVFCMAGPMACQKEEGPAEKAGKKIDQALDSVKKKVEEATEK